MFVIASEIENELASIRVLAVFGGTVQGGWWGHNGWRL